MAKAEQALEPEAEPQVRKSKKKLLALLGAGLLLLGGAGGGTWYFFGPSPSAPAAEAAEQKAPVYVRLETFTVNLRPADEERYLQTDIVLRVPDDKEAEIFKQHMPETRSRLLSLLSSKNVEDLLATEGQDRLMKEIAEVMKKPFSTQKVPQKVSGVFFNSFVIQ